MSVTSVTADGNGGNLPVSNRVGASNQGGHTLEPLRRGRIEAKSSSRLWFALSVSGEVSAVAPSDHQVDPTVSANTVGKRSEHVPIDNQDCVD